MSMFSEQNAGQYIVVSEPVSDPSQVSGRVELFNEDGSPFSGGGGGGAPTFSDILATPATNGPAMNINSVRGAKLGKLAFLHLDVSLPNGWAGGAAAICELPQEWKPARTHICTGIWTADGIPSTYVIPFYVDWAGNIANVVVAPSQTTGTQAYFVMHTSYEAFS